MRDENAVQASDGESQSNRDVGLLVLGFLSGVILASVFFMFWR
jgi:hypothetical protein